ncbi:hypothetical protein [Deinococcus alpinitundrae]|uniref:hypothetical protein n=1 Tax=Deinococcus alpinitundrae TaxID=468913 RepID=UPI00137AAD45|nr:hypothetical protein [Deinococcus alpinitundrae]
MSFSSGQLICSKAGAAESLLLQRRLLRGPGVAHLAADLAQRSGDLQEVRVVARLDVVEQHLEAEKTVAQRVFFGLAMNF